MVLLRQWDNDVDAAWNGTFESAAVSAVGWGSRIANLTDGTLGTAVDSGVCTTGSSRCLLWNGRTHYNCDILRISVVSFSDGDLGLNIVSSEYEGGLHMWNAAFHEFGVFK